MALALGAVASGCRVLPCYDGYAEVVAVGAYVNTGNEGFEQMLADEYVDKTGLITLVSGAIGKPRPLVCVTRPRRFGKSFAVRSLVAYYSCGADSRDLFAGLAVEGGANFEEHLNAYNLIRLDLTSFTTTEGADVVPALTRRLMDDLAREFPDVPLRDGLDLALLDVYNDEQALRFAVKLAYLTAVDTFAEIEELPSGNGYADIVYLPKRYARMPAMVVELKWDQSPECALAQIRDRHYPEALAGFGGNVLLVGISYDRNAAPGHRRHRCIIEQV